MIMGINTSLIIAFLFSILFPVGLAVWWKKRTGAKLWCFLAGAICFPVFALGLEGVLHSVVLGGNTSLSQALLSSPILYTLYGSLAAGIFEETGRLFGFRVLLRNHQEKECAVAYGIGHGGIEILIILGLNYLLLMLAQGGVTFGSQAETSALLETAKNIPFSTAGLAMFERLSAMMLHIGLSMIMFVASWQKGKLWLYPAAILMHALIDVGAALYQVQVIRSVAIVELWVFALGLLYLAIGRRLLKGLDKPKQD